MRKADQIKIILKATDWRGDILGQQCVSDPIILHVTDIRGIFSQLGDDDKKSVKQLDEILRRELAIGSDQ